MRNGSATSKPCDRSTPSFILEAPVYLEEILRFALLFVMHLQVVRHASRSFSARFFKRSDVSEDNTIDPIDDGMAPINRVIIKSV